MINIQPQKEKEPGKITDIFEINNLMKNEFYASGKILDKRRKMVQLNPITPLHIGIAI